MSFLKEAMRLASTISVEQGLYVLAVVIVAAAIAIYRWSRNTGVLWKALMSFRRLPIVRPTWRRRNDAEDAVHIETDTTDSWDTFDHPGLQRTLAKLQDRSSRESAAAFDTVRVKSEVLEPMHKYVLDLDKALASTKVELSCDMHMSGGIGNGESWDCYRWGDSLSELPHHMLNLEVLVRLDFSIALSSGRESEHISARGWFAHGGGKWTVSKGLLEENGRESPMYNWYGVKQHFNEHVKDVLEQLMRAERGD